MWKNGHAKSFDYLLPAYQDDNTCTQLKGLMAKPKSTYNSVSKVLLPKWDFHKYPSTSSQWFSPNAINFSQNASWACILVWVIIAHFIIQLSSTSHSSRHLTLGLMHSPCDIHSSYIKIIQCIEQDSDHCKQKIH
jgi:hypothetical protein